MFFNYSLFNLSFQKNFCFLKFHLKVHILPRTNKENFLKKFRRL